MAVKRSRGVSARSAILVGLSGVVVALALAVGALWLAGSGGEVEIRLGDSDFGDLDADRISAEIAEQGPVLFSDVAGGSRDLIVQHLGDDPERGWSAFDARRPGQPRDCFFRWRADLTSDDAGGSAVGGFANTCDESDTVDAAGTGLTHYPVAVHDGKVTIDINNPVRG